MVAPRGAFMVALGGHVWLLRGRGACVVAQGACVHGIRRDTEIRSISGRYASYWNAFLLFFKFQCIIVSVGDGGFETEAGHDYVEFHGSGEPGNACGVLPK